MSSTFSTSVGCSARNQTVVANTTGAYTHTDYTYLFASAPSSFGYRTKGRAYRLQSEAIYENRLRPFTLTAGLRHTQKYVCNDYRGDATLLSQMRTSHLYADGLCSCAGL